MEINKIIKNRNAPANIWNLKEKDNQRSLTSLIAQLNKTFILEFSNLFKLCSSIVNCPLSKIFADDIASLLSSVSDLEDYAKNVKDCQPHALEAYASYLVDIKYKFDKVKKLAFSDNAGSSTASSQLSKLILNIEEEKDNYDDYNMESKNQEVDEYNVLDDSLTFCNRVVDRFESRLFGYGERSLEQEVEDLIQKARSRERLANMYEGWMPWI